MGTSGNRKMVFKRFTVRDEKCAMKIGTDGVMIGAWASPNHNHKKTQFQIADIGSGSGVIALMLAQRFPESFITAVELEDRGLENAQKLICNRLVHQTKIRLLNLKTFCVK